MSTPSNSDRRVSGKRKRARFPIRFWNGKQQGHGQTLDLSSTGLYVETAATLEIGTRLHFEIQHPDGTFHGEAVVARKKRVPQHLRAVARPGVGLRLVPLTSLLRVASGGSTSHTLFELTADLSDPGTLRQAYAVELGGGVLLVPCTPPAPPIGAAVHVEVKLPPPFDSLTWRGRVVQKRDEPCEAAVELLDRAQVDALVREILDSYRGA